jgi:hypothetical protein
MRLSVVLLATVITLVRASADQIDVIHVVSMNHLDVGFTDLSTNVVNKYFDNYFPLAIKTSNTLRERKSPIGYIYTTHSWLVSLYLDCPQDIWVNLHCPNATSQQNLREAIKRGDITWHAFPFNTETDMLDSSLADYAISIAHDLDKQFGLPKKNTLSQRDVPGITRALIPRLVAAGVKAISMGVNGASAPPDCGKVFRWKNKATNEEVLGMIHPNGYGGYGYKDAVIIEGFNEALVWMFRNDNLGPHQVEEVLKGYNDILKIFPHVKEVKASTYDAFVNKVLARQDIIDSLPVVTAEMGDTWLYGVPSDPLKVLQYRDILRYRESCIRAKQCDVNDARIKNFSRFLVKIAEHTWGMDVKTFLADSTNWKNADLERNRHTAKNFLTIQNSWFEQRSFIDMAVEALFDHPLRKHIEDNMKYRKASISRDLSSYTPVKQTRFNAGRFTIQFDNQTGQITTLIDNLTKRSWASTSNPLLTLLYRSYNSTDYDKFFAEYFYCDDCPWAPLDFGKPGLKEHGNFPRGEYRPTLKQIYHKSEGNLSRFVLELKFEAVAHEVIGAPDIAHVHIDVPMQGQEIFIDVQLFNKTATRCPESLFVSFNPYVQNPDRWFIDKLGQLISPLDIIKNGSHHQHGVGKGVHYIEKDGDEPLLSVESLDTPVVTFGEATGFSTPLNEMPDMKKGFHYTYINTVWGTNYIMWYPFGKPGQDIDSSMIYVLKFSDN